LKSQEATGTAWIGLEQNFIDTALQAILLQAVEK